MISKIKFKQLKENNFLVVKNRVKNPSIRQVEKNFEGPYINLYRTNREYFRGSTVTYTYSDIAHRIIGVWRLKQKN